MAQFVGLVIGLWLATASPNGVGRIAFYDPDANHHAIVSAATLFNDYLDGSGRGLRLQPVQNPADLERLLDDEFTRFVIAPAAYVRRQRKDLKPLLVPSRNNQVYYRKLLVDTGKNAPGKLSGKRIAVTLPATTPKAADQVLQLIASKGVDVHGAVVIPVAKDIDALLAQQFGQVDAALVTPASLEAVKRINPSASFRIIFETDPILSSPLCAISGKTSPEEERAVIELVRKMTESVNGKRALGALGYDGWAAFEPSMIR